MSDIENTIQEELASEEETLVLREKRAKARKKENIARGVKTALLILAITAVIAGAGILIHSLVFGRQQVPAEIPPITAQPETQPQAPAETPVESVTPTQTEQTPAPPEDAATEKPTEAEQSEQPAQPEQPAETEAQPKLYAQAEPTDDTQELDLQLYSSSAILIDRDTNAVIAEKNADEKIYPASMTKILTVLVASEHIENWDDTVTITQEIIDPLFLAGASMAGFTAGEQVSLRDLLYGAVLPSGAEATDALALYVAGSEKDFVALMNEKVQALGLTTSHFTNVSGLHDEEHYSTVRDMAVILQAALDNPMCAEVLSSTFHTSTKTEQNPEGVSMENKFLYNIAQRTLSGAQVLGAKTGYTSQAANCCASYGISPEGRNLLCVTAKAWTGEFCIDDHVALYTLYSK